MSAFAEGWGNLSTPERWVVVFGIFDALAFVVVVVALAAGASSLVWIGLASLLVGGVALENRARAAGRVTT